MPIRIPFKVSSSPLPAGHLTVPVSPEGEINLNPTQAPGCWIKLPDKADGAIYSIKCKLCGQVCGLKVAGGSGEVRVHFPCKRSGEN